MVNQNFGPAQLAVWLAMNLTFVIGTVGTALAPLALGGLSRENARRALPGGLLAGLVFTGALLLRRGVGAPLDPEFTWSLRWSLRELGATEPLVPPLTMAPVRSLGWALSAMLVATLSLAVALAPVLRRRPRGPVSSLAWGALGYFALSTVLWLFYDRYALPLVVVVVALRLGTVGIPSLRLALVGVAMFITISGIGTWDHLQYSHALWNAVAWARQAGIEDRQLDGGYVVNGWLQYAHPEHAGLGLNGDVQVPGVNGGEPPRYGIVKRVPPDSRVLHVVPYRRIIAPSGSIYVIDRTPEPLESPSSRAAQLQHHG
jgi:hypothetical protein